MNTQAQGQTGERRLLLQFFKALADENRLRMIGLLSQEEYRVSDLAATLELTEPTVSHHLSRLRELGLVNLRSVGNNRYYRLNIAMLNRMKQAVARMEALARVEPDDKTWIDELDVDAYDRKILRDYTINGRLKQIPSKEKKLLVILRWLATKFEEGVKYTEREVNAIITPFYEDYATLRRDLIDFGFLRRERGGGLYWLTPEDEEV